MGREPQWNVILKLNVWVCLALVPLFIAHANSKLDKPVSREITDDNHLGFISIDCGSDIDYLDEETGIWYQTDKDFVETGINHMVSSDINLNYPSFGKLFNTLRFFPDGDKNCYTLKPEQDKNNSYLIRAFFAYGNYDAKNQTPSFDLYLGVNYWESIGFMPYYHYAEIIHTPTTDTIHVCLVKTGSTIPYISALELRLLNSSIYHVMSSSSPQPLLYLRARLDVNSAPTRPLGNILNRYKDDVYDRVWYDYNQDGWHPLVLNEIDIDPRTADDAYKLPSQVLSTAARSMNVSYALEFDYDSVYWALDKSSEYTVYFHFAEIEKLPRGEKRIINITLNSENILSQPLVLEYLKPVTITPQNTTQGYVRFNITATSESNAPPILNAFEVYRLITPLSPTDTRDVGAILDIKSAYQISRLNWQGDPCLPKQHAWEGLMCSSDVNPRITSLNLSSSKLAGEINTSFSYLTELEFLDLSDNELEGPIPEFLAELPKLEILNLRGNKLSGSIPKALKEKADIALKLSVADNPDLCMTDSCKKKNFVAPLVASLSALIVIFLISLGFWIFKRRQKAVMSMNKPSCSNKIECVDSKKQEFTYSEVLSITNNFERVVGKGGFGTVYYGCIGETQVAVKMLSPSTKGYQQFQTEAKILTRVHHKCLTPLIGYCNEGTKTAIIYEYMANGNLAEHLSDKSQQLLGWKHRLQIALDSAIGLEYLHNGCKPPIVHRDVKTSNILLNENFRGKISDFGLSRIFPDECDTHVSTVIAGTPGYLDPEHYKTNRLNEKSDVFSFGVVLLEIITGRSAILKTHEKTHIIQWVSSMLADQGEIDGIMDPRIQGEYDTETAKKAVDVAMACVAQSSVNRPTMNQVVIELKQCLAIENLGSTSSGLIEIVSWESISGESSLAR